MIDKKYKSIKDMVKQINLSLTDKKQVIEEVANFICENNLIDNGIVNIEEIKHIYKENQFQSNSNEIDRYEFIGCERTYPLWINYSTNIYENRLFKLFCYYSCSSYEFNKFDIEILKLRLYEIFYPRIMNEELNQNKHLLKIRDITDIKTVSTNYSVWNEINWVWWLVGGLCLIAIIIPAVILSIPF